MPPVDNVLLVALLAGMGWAWYLSLAARERALTAVRSICTELKLQALDQTVALRSLRPCRRADSGRMDLRRVYGFEFSTGRDRCPGWVGFEGAELRWVHLEHPEGPIHFDV